MEKHKKKRDNNKRTIKVLCVINGVLFVGFILTWFAFYTADKLLIGSLWRDMHHNRQQHLHLLDALENRGVLPSAEECYEIVMTYCNAEGMDEECSAKGGEWCFVRFPDPRVEP